MVYQFVGLDKKNINDLIIRINKTFSVSSSSSNFIIHSVIAFVVVNNVLQEKKKGKN